MTQSSLNIFAYSDSNRVSGSTVTFHCLNDTNGFSYVLDGSSILTCQTTGSWDETVPTCVIQCPTITLYTTGTQPAVNITYSDQGNADDRTPTTTAAYKCPSGYIIFGIMSSTCQSDGSWLPAPASDGLTPYCLFMPPAVQVILEQMTNLTVRKLFVSLDKLIL